MEDPLRCVRTGGDFCILCTSSGQFDSTRLTWAERQGLKKYPVGGIVVFRQNVKSPEQLKKLLADFQAASGIGLLTAVNEEGGSWGRRSNDRPHHHPQCNAGRPACVALLHYADRASAGGAGVICTDSLSMQAIRDHYSAAEAAVAALNAGADLLLMPPDLPEAFDGVLEAVQNGTISEECLNESVRRILMLKQKAGLELDTRTPLEKMLDVFLQD